MGRLMKAKYKPLKAFRIAWVSVTFQANNPLMDEDELQDLAKGSVIPYREVLLQTRPPFSEWVGIRAWASRNWEPCAEYQWIFCDLTGRGKRWELAFICGTTAHFPRIDHNDDIEIFADCNKRDVFCPTGKGE